VGVLARPTGDEAKADAAGGGEGAALTLALDALRGLEHVHFHGVVHCDVKPANILVSEPGPAGGRAGRAGVRRAVLGDFDLSLDQVGLVRCADRPAAVWSSLEESVRGKRSSVEACAACAEPANLLRCGRRWRSRCGRGGYHRISYRRVRLGLDRAGPVRIRLSRRRRHGFSRADTASVVTGIAAADRVATV
jgi:serine/threonine protein kinase